MESRKGMKKREKNLIKNTFFLGIGEMVPKFTGLVTLPIYTLMLTKSEYGTYDLVSLIVSVLVPVITLQIQQGTFRYIVQYRDDEYAIKRIISCAYFYVVPVSALSLCIFFFLMPGTKTIRIFICVYLFVYTLFGEIRKMTRGFGRNLDYSIATVINAVGNLIFTFIFLYCLDLGLEGALTALILAALLAVFYLSFKQKIWNYISFTAFDRKLLKEMLYYSIPLVPNIILRWIVNFSDRTVITLILGVEMNAVYAVANKIPQLLETVYNTFNMSWTESASLAVDDLDSDEFGTTVFQNMFRVLVGMMALLIGFAPIIFSLLIKGSYDDAYLQMPFLFLNSFFCCLTSFYGVAYLAKKQTVKIAISSFVGAVINVAVHLLLIQRIGLYAASISTFVSYFVLAVYRMYDTRNLMKIKYNYVSMAIEMFLLIMMCGICYLRNFWGNVFNLIFGVTVAVVLNYRLILSILGNLRSWFQKTALSK